MSAQPNFEVQSPASMAGCPELSVVADPPNPSHVEKGFLDTALQKIHGRAEVPGVWSPVDYTISIPENLQSPHLHLVIPGYGGFKRSSRKLRDALAQDHGVATISYQPPRHGGVRNDLLHPQRAHCDTVDAVLEHAYRSISDLDDNKTRHLVENKSVLLPHSMGGIAAASRATRRSEDTEAVVFIESVGADGPNMLKFIPRLPQFAKKEVATAIRRGEFGRDMEALVMLWHCTNYYMRNFVRTGGEAVSCMRADLRPKLKLMGQLDVRTGLLYGGLDGLVPAKAAITGSGDLVDHWRIVEDFDHLAPQTKANMVAHHIVEITTELSRQK